MWEKLKQLARRYDEIGELLEVPEIYADPKKLRALTREQKELSAVVETYRAYQKCEDDIVQALELVSDPELKDMAQEELNTCASRQSSSEGSPSCRCDRPCREFRDIRSPAPRRPPPWLFSCFPCGNSKGIKCYRSYSVSSQQEPTGGKGLPHIVVEL